MAQERTTFYALRNDRYDLEYIKHTTDFHKVTEELSILKKINPRYVKHPLNTYGGLNEWDIEYIKTEPSNKYETVLTVKELKEKRKSVSVGQYTAKIQQQQKREQNQLRIQANKDKRERQRKESIELKRKNLSDKLGRELDTCNL